MDIQELKKILEPYKNTLILDMYTFTVKRLIDVEECEEDNYWVFDSIHDGITKSSCCGQWIPLKGVLLSEQYQKMVNIWNYNVDSDKKVI